MTCDHSFTYLGVRYADSDYSRPGSSAHTRYYAETFYCPKCLEHHYLKMIPQSDNFTKPLFDAIPAAHPEKVKP